MLDIRWLVVTVVSVFLALGIGMLAGGAATGQSLAERQAAAIARLERELGQLRTDEQAAGRALAAERQFAASAVPWIVAGRLAGHRIAAVASGPVGPEFGGVMGALQLAGAGAFAVVVDGDWASASDGVRAAVTKRWPEGAGDGGDLLPLVAAHLAAAVASGDPAGDLPFLSSLGLVHTLGPPPGAPTDVVLFAGPRPPQASETLLGAVLRASRAAGLQVAAAEEVVSNPSLLPAFERWGLSVVDDADEAAGQAALILVLAGQRGHFGVKAGAQGALPPWSAP